MGVTSRSAKKKPEPEPKEPEWVDGSVEKGYASESRDYKNTGGLPTFSDSPKAGTAILLSLYGAEEDEGRFAHAPSRLGNTGGEAEDELLKRRGAVFLR